MMKQFRALAVSVATLGLLGTMPAKADPITFFSTNDPDGKMATASRPESAGKIEIESADDFILGSSTLITGATFTGLLQNANPANVGEVRVEIYRVFPNDSNVGRTSGSPTFSTPQVPTRMNSPSDVAFTDRDTASGNLSFTTTTLNANFTAAKSVLAGINPKPGQTTGGEPSVTGMETRFNVDFTTPLFLPAGHYFFVPQVELTDAAGEFFWLSAPRPIVPPGTPFLPDLQEWIRNANLDPDWLRVGTDIVGGDPAPTFNAAFSLVGQAAPEPDSLALLFVALAGTMVTKWRKLIWRKRSVKLNCLSALQPCG